MQTVLLVGIVLFVFTHLDTLVVLIAFCADEGYPTSDVLIGHYAGFGIGLVGAVLGAILAAGVLEEWTFLLGIVPLAMGLWGVRRRLPESEFSVSDPAPGHAGRIGTVTAAGVGLSGENLAVFIPFFAGLARAELVMVLLTYLVGAAVVFAVAVGFVRLLPPPRMPVWIDRWLVPVVLIWVGGYVVVSGWLVG